MKTCLVTGGAGFIGSNFIINLLEKKSDWKIVNLDKLTYAGSLSNLNEVSTHPRYQFVHGDILDRKLVENLFEEYQFQGVFHFAAESHVDNSILGPDAFIKANIEGTFILLDVARKFWMESPFKVKENFSSARFHHVSTDEVYGSLGEEGLFSESTPYAPNSPYSASKASSDFIVRSYFHTYGMNVVTTNCSNNYGPRQHDEKLIPTIIRNALKGALIPIYGNGKNIRDWLFVDDHCSGIMRAFEQGKSGETYNIGGLNERRNIDIANLICAALDRKRPLKGKSYYEQIKYVTDRPGHDLRYAIDASKIEQQLGWQHANSFEVCMDLTIDWYLQKYMGQ